MRYLIVTLLTAFCLVSAQAVEQPKSHKEPERPAYPVLTMQGLEDLQLGAPAPSACSFPGLTTKSFQEEDWNEDGRRFVRTSLKLYHNGFYLGRALLDDQKRVIELEITDWRVAYQGNFAPASTWKQVKANLSDTKLHYAYMLEALVAESPDLPGLQVHFPLEAYRVQGKLKGDFTPLNPAELPLHAKATKMRLFWVPVE